MLTQEGSPAAASLNRPRFALGLEAGLAKRAAAHPNSSFKGSETSCQGMEIS